MSGTDAVSGNSAGSGGEGRGYVNLYKGEVIHGRYRLDKLIATGGMGQVWKAYDIRDDRPVAIKTRRGDVGDVADPNKLARLRLEAKNSANLAHPNIAGLLDYYEKNGTGFLVMEYVDGPTLVDIFKQKAPMRPEELLPIITQVARGLYVAHSRGVIHRDIKPANIMLTRKGEVKITDFGVSYATNQMDITPQGMVVGTVQYISPEQAQGLEVTPQTDIYSLGVVLYEGLCGHRPFTGSTPVDIASAHVREPVPPLPDYVDWRLRQYVMGMLAKDPRQRPASALQVAQDLEGISNHILDEQTASIPKIAPDATGRIVQSHPVEPVHRMIDLTDPSAVLQSARERDPRDVFDVHFGPGGVERVSQSKRPAHAKDAPKDPTRRPGAPTLGETVGGRSEYSFSAYGIPDISEHAGEGERPGGGHVPRHARRADNMGGAAGNDADNRDRDGDGGGGRGGRRKDGAQ